MAILNQTSLLVQFFQQHVLTLFLCYSFVILTLIQTFFYPYYSYP
jgi:hypothetical protein